MTAALLAAAAAACFAVASVLQHGAASRVAVEHGGPLSLILRLVREPRWLAGKVADLVAFALQAVALAHGAFVAVQAVLACGVLLALLLRAWRSGRALTAREWAAALAVVTGLTLLIGVGRPGGGHRQASPSAWAIATLAVAAVVVVALVRGRHVEVAGAGVWLALGTGAAFALDAGCLKSAADAVHDHGAGRLAVLAFGGFLVAAAAGNVLIQRAFQISPLHVALPALVATEPVGAVALGFLLYGERLRGGAVAVPAEVAGLIVLVAGVIAAARYEADAEEDAETGDGVTAPKRS